MSAPAVTPMRVHLAEVVDVLDLSPGMRRVVFGGDGVADYGSTGVGDEYIRLIFPREPDAAPDLPDVGEKGLDYTTVDLDRLRTYTVRDHDPDAGRITVDFVVHDGGVAAAWALRAEPGHLVGLNTPTALYDPPAELGWQVLVADYAGAPAALRIAALTPTVRTRLILEVPDDEHRLELPDRPRLEVTWVVGGNGHGPSRLEEIVRTVPRPEGDGYVWVAGEAKAVRGVRKHLRHELRLPATAYKAVGYWIAGAETWRERYDALDEQTRAELDAIWQSDRDEEEQEDEYDARLTELGL